MTVLLNSIIFLPLLGALLQVLPIRRNVASGITLALSIGTSAVTFGLIFLHYQDLGTMLTFQAPWIEAFSINYSLGLDGLSAPFLFSSSILFPLALIVEKDRERGRPGLFAILLLSQVAINGLAVSQDILLLIVFWFLASIPVFFLVSVFGQNAKELRAHHLIGVTIFSSALALVSALLIYYSKTPGTFLLNELRGITFSEIRIFKSDYFIQLDQLALIFLAAAVLLRGAYWPFHGWYQRMLEVLGPFHGFVTFLSIGPASFFLFLRVAQDVFPSLVQQWQPVWLVIGVMGMFFQTMSLFGLKDLRIIYSKIAAVSLGTLWIGLASGTSSGLLGGFFILIGFVFCYAGASYIFEYLTQEFGRVEIQDLEELGRRYPGFGPFLIIFTGSLMGFPGTVGFIGSVLSLMGDFQRYPLASIFSALLLVAVSIFLFLNLKIVFRMLESPEPKPLSLKSRVVLIPIVMVILVLGIFPAPLVKMMRTTIEATQKGDAMAAK